MDRTINDKIQHDWVRIYQYGCTQEPVRGLCCEENIQGYGAEHFFYAKATIIGHREVNVDTCEADMNTRVRHWSLYFDNRETTAIVRIPKPCASFKDGVGNIGKEGNRNACSHYYKHYYLDIGKLVGIFGTKKKAKQVGERLLDQRRLWVEQRLEVFNKMQNKSIVSDDIELPFE